MRQLEEKININDFIDESSLIDSRDINASFSLGNLKYEAQKVFLFKNNQLYILMKRTKINPFQRYDTNYDFIYEDDLNFTYNFPIYNNGQLQVGVEYSVYNKRVFL